ncbi:hypothetical protein ACMFMG_006951 [Clarireedia jacksonii]
MKTEEAVQPVVVNEVKKREQPEAAGSATKRQKPNFSEASELVTFIVGPRNAEKSFVVHKEFACYYSPVLQAVFHPGDDEGRTQTYRFQEDRHERTFKMLVQWFYTQSIDVPCEESGFVYDNRQMTADSDALVKLWILAENLHIPSCQDTVLEKLNTRRIMLDEPAFECIPYIYLEEH